MTKIITYIQENFCVICMAIIPAGLYLAPIPFISPLYYLLLLVLTVLAITKNQRINIPAVLLILSCILSIIFGNPDPIFKSWSRLGLFILLICSFFPVFQSHYFDYLRSKLFVIVLFLITITSVGSFPAYFLGINYMISTPELLTAFMREGSTGLFGGLTTHSMTLGMISALALIILAWWLLLQCHSKKQYIIFGILAGFAFISMLLSASRIANLAGAVGVITILMLKYGFSLTSIIKKYSGIVILCLILAPIFTPYAGGLISKQSNNEKAGSTFSSRQSRWEHRLEEFDQNLLFGCGFVSVDTKYQDEYVAYSGIVEPGSSWLAILSMTGIFSFLSFGYLMLSTMKKLTKLHRYEDDSWALLHLGIMIAFCVHFIAEGYIYSAGGGLCYLFWFFFGCAYSYARDPIPYVIPLINDEAEE